MVVGAPYTVGTTSYTPADTMNYDAVGYAAVTDDGDATISAGHHTLPVPSYIEVTALETGRTILVRVAHRGPMDSNSVIALSAGAAAQLGVGDHAAVRVRRVNPPENERELLRSGSNAPLRMDTPKPLLAVLMRKLQPGAPVGLNPSTAGSVGQPAYAVSHTAPPQTLQPQSILPKTVVAMGKAETAAKPMVNKPTPALIPRLAPKVKPARITPPKAADVAPEAPAQTELHEAGSLVIQAGAFSDKARAEALAAKIGGKVSAAGHLWRVRKGPYPSQGAANAALAKVRAAGYSGARIQHAE